MANTLRTCALLALAAALVLVPGAAAQVGTFGSQVKAGDPDYVLTAKTVRSLSVNQHDYAYLSGGMMDNCVVLDTRSTQAAGATNKMIRLTPCAGKDAGTLIAEGDNTEKQSTYSQVTGESIRYGDVDGGGSFGTGDYVYLTTNAGGTGLDASTGPASFTVRLTAAGSFKAGTWVLNGDSDFMQFGSSATPLSGPSIVERDDGAWHVVSQTTANFRVGMSVPASSVRIHSPALNVPDVRVTSFKVLTETPTAGQELVVEAALANSGKAPGIGLLAFRLDGVLIDARLTSPISAGAKTSMMVTFKVPARPGTFEFKVGDVFAPITLAPGPGAPETPATDVLLGQITALTTRLDALEAAFARQQASDVAIAQELVEAPKGKSPTANGLVTLALLGAGVVLLRRRA